TPRSYSRRTFSELKSQIKTIITAINTNGNCSMVVLCGTRTWRIASLEAFLGLAQSWYRNHSQWLGRCCLQKHRPRVAGWSDILMYTDPLQGRTFEPAVHPRWPRGGVHHSEGYFPCGRAVEIVMTPSL